ncbi:MAG: glycosyltransferase family 4 protein, partial [Spirochaetota bacterium]
QDTLLRALSEVKQRSIPFELQIIGSGPLLNDLSELAKSLDIADRVHFLGAQNQDIVIELLKKSDIFILPSRSEGLPVSCMEAMAMEVFLIATRICGIPELVSNNKNGLLIEPEDVLGLADAICWANQNRHTLKAMTKVAREKVKKDFDRRKCTKNLILEINSIYLANS